MRLEQDGNHYTNLCEGPPGNPFQGGPHDPRDAGRNFNVCRYCLKFIFKREAWWWSKTHYLIEESPW